MNAAQILGTVLVSTLAVAAHAAPPSSPTEFRGYTSCVNAADEELRGMVPSRSYFVSQEAQTTSYYINATAWQNAEREYVRVACDTVRAGREVVSLDIAPGRYVEQEGVVTIQLAAN